MYCIKHFFEWRIIMLMRSQRIILELLSTDIKRIQKNYYSSFPNFYIPFQLLLICILILYVLCCYMFNLLNVKTAAIINIIIPSTAIWESKYKPTIYISKVIIICAPLLTEIFFCDIIFNGVCQKMTRL